MIFLERTREGHHESGEHWNCFKCIVGESSERWVGFFKCINTIWNGTDLV